MSNANYLHTLKIKFRHIDDPFLYEVREGEATRLEEILSTLAPGRINDNGFFWFDTIDGKSVSINLKYCQMVNFLWDGTTLPKDTTRFDGLIDVYLAGSEPISTWCAYADQLYKFYSDLEYGPGMVQFSGFVDGDGEQLMFNLDEIVLVQAPMDFLDDGRLEFEKKLEDECGY